MKYMIEFSGGSGGIYVVDVPRVDATSYELSLDEDGTLTAAAIDLGFSYYYDMDEVVEEFISYCEEILGVRYSYDDIFKVEEINDEFWEFANDNMLWYVPKCDCFIEDSMEVKPVPPTYEVGVYKCGEKPKLRRYQGMGR